MSARIAVLLDAYLGAQDENAFSWARRNCCHFVAGWIRSVTDQADPMQGLPVTPSRAAALRLVRQLGGNLMVAWTRQLGRGPVAAELARTGDIALVRMPGTGAEAVGICSGRHVALLTERDGIAMLPLAHAVAAWRLQPDEAAP